jgi:mono/diheme cytochrome c family protein
LLNLVYTRKPDPKNGKVVNNGGCIVCHGAEEKGAPEKNTEFKRPFTFPDFSRCDRTTPEPDSAWKAVVVHGGRYYGFSAIMPAFKDLLSNDQIDDVVAYLRTFCPTPHWPRGELNLPRALVSLASRNVRF